VISSNALGHSWRSVVIDMPDVLILCELHRPVLRARFRRAYVKGTRARLSL